MIMSKHSIIAVLLTISALSAAGQQKSMGLKECMEYAVSNSTKVRIQQAETGDARIERREAILSAFTPQVSAGVSAYYNFGRAIDPQTNTYINTTSFHNNYSLSAGITLFDGFSALNNIKIAKTSLAMGNSREDQVEADICLATMEAYYNAVYYSKMSEIYRSQVQTAQSSLELARKQETLGMKGYADVVQAEADLAERQYSLTNAENLRTDAMMTLQDVMFWPLDSSLVIDTAFADEDALASAPDENEEEIIGFAMANQPSALIAHGNMENARLALNTAKWQLLPTLNLYAGWSTTYFEYPGIRETDPFRTQFSNNGGEYVQLSLNIPLYDRLKGLGNISRKRHAYQKASAEYDQKLRDIESEVRRAVQDRDGAAAAYLQAERKAEVQEESWQLNTRKYEQGLISGIEYQTATDSYLAARADRLNSMFKYLLKKSVVEYYGGTRYIDQK